MDLVTADHPQLLLLETIECGRTSNVFDGLFLENLREEGVQLTIGFAQKFYNAHYETSLRLARDIVLGVCNLGLIICSNTDVQKSMVVLRKEGLLHVFRKGFSALQALSDLSKDVMYSVQNLCLEIAYSNGDKPWEGYANYREIKCAIERTISYEEFLATFAGQHVDRQNWEKVSITKMLSVILMVGEYTGELTLAGVQKTVLSLAQCDDDVVRERIDTLRGSISQKHQTGFDMVAAEVVDLITRVRVHEEASILNIFLQELHVRYDVDEILQMDENVIAQLSKEELLEAIRIDLTDDPLLYINTVLKHDLTMRELIDAIDASRDLTNVCTRIAWHRYREKQIAALLSRETNLQRAHVLTIDWARYMYERAEDTAWGLRIGEHMIDVIIQSHPTTVLALSQYMILATKQINGRDDVGYAPFLLHDPYEFYMEARSGEEHRIFTVYADVLAYTRDVRSGNKGLLELLEQIIAGLKKAKTKKTDPVYYDHILRSHIHNSRAKALYEQLLRA